MLMHTFLRNESYTTSPLTTSLVQQETWDVPHLQEHQVHVSFLQGVSISHFFIAPLIHIQQLKDACLASQKIRSSYFSHPFVHPYFSADQPGLGCGAISEQLHPPPHRRGGGGGPLRAGGAPARGAGADGRFPGLEQHGQNPGVAKGALEDENEENHWKSTGKQ